MGLGIQWAVMLLMFINGGAIGGRDLLDVIPTARYWQAEKIVPTVGELVADAGPDEAVVGVEKLVADLGSDDFKVRNKAKRKLEDMGAGVLPLVTPAVDSKDSEVAAAASEIVAHVNERGKARSVKRLMAIRTLGEMKEKSAVEMLKGLERSQELFVADYAGRAVARITGEDNLVEDHRKDVAGDFELLPKDTGVVGQSVGLWKGGMTLDAAVDLAIADAAGNPFLGGGGVVKIDRERVMTRVTEEMLKIAERVGNVRLDGMTMGVSEKMQGDSGWAVTILHGEYDQAAMIAALKEEALKNNGPGDAVKFEKIEGIDALRLDNEVTVYAPSAERFVIVMGGKDSYVAVNEVMVKSLKAGKGGIGGNEKIAGLMKGVDREGPVWVVGNVNEEAKGAPMFAAFDRFVGTTKRGKDSATFELKGEGTDVEKVKASADEMDGGIKATLQQLKPMMGQMKGMQPVMDFLESIKVKAEGTRATMTGEVKDSFFEAVVGEVGGMAVMELSEEEERAGATRPGN